MTPARRPQPRRRVNESGNILFLILVAVALFAFLSYVVAASTRSGVGDGDTENTSLRASQIIQYATYVEQAVLRMRFRGVADAEFCFHHDGWGHNNYDHAGCSEPKNLVFSTLPEAGGIIWSRPPVGANDGSPWTIPANVCVAGVGKDVIAACDSDGTGTSEDIVLILPNVARPVCMAINDQLDVMPAKTEPPQAGAGIMYSSGSFFSGTFADGGVINSAGTDPHILRGKQFGCVQANGTPPAGTYHYFHVLLPR